MTDTTVDVSRDGTTAILRIRGEITGGSEPPIMAAYARPTARASIVLDFCRARLHEQRWDRAAGHPPRPRPAGGPAAARRRPLGALPPDPLPDPPRRGHLDPRRRGRARWPRPPPPDRSAHDDDHRAPHAPRPGVVGPPRRPPVHDRDDRRRRHRHRQARLRPRPGLRPDVAEDVQGPPRRAATWTPEAVVAHWKAGFPTFWPKGANLLRAAGRHHARARSRCSRCRRSPARR